MRRGGLSGSPPSSISSLSGETPICAMSLVEIGMKIDGAPPVCHAPGQALPPTDRCGLHRSPEQYCSLVPFYRGGNGSFASELGLDLMCSTWKPQVSPGCQWPWVIKTQEGKAQTKRGQRKEKAGEGRRRGSSEGPMGRLEEGRGAGQAGSQ